MAEIGHYPYQAGIDAYGNGGFRFAGMSHRGSLLCLPTGMTAWDVASPGDVTLASLAPVLAVAGMIDVLFLGLGDDIAAVDPAIRQALKDHRIILEATSTGSAARTYNVLFNEKRAIAAALIAVTKAK